MKTVKTKMFGLFTGIFLLLFQTGLSANQKITICTDANFWYPFSYVDHEKKAAGLHIDIIRAALTKLGFEPIYKPHPWQDCFEQAKLGMVDAVASVSYRDERATYLDYPMGAAVDLQSPWRIMQIGYVVVTIRPDQEQKSKTPIFTGQLQDIPQPIRATAHYSVIQDLEKAGLKVKSGKSTAINFQQLLKERTGSVVDVEEVAQYFMLQPEFSQQLMIQKKLLNNKSYYLAFAKQATIDEATKEAIWQEVARVRDDPNLMAEFLKKYSVHPNGSN